MIIKIAVDKEKAKSMILMIENREKFVKSNSEFITIVVENYYEIIKELITLILMLESKKAIGEYAHKDMIDEMGKSNMINEEELRIIDDLRIKRNKSLYEGKQVAPVYIENNKTKLEKIIKKLKNIADEKMNS